MFLNNLQIQSICTDDDQFNQTVLTNIHKELYSVQKSEYRIYT